MAKFTVTYNTTISLAVDLEAEDSDEAGEKSRDLAEEYLKSIGGNYRDIRAEASLDGIGYDTVEEKEQGQ